MRRSAWVALLALAGIGPLSTWLGAADAEDVSLTLALADGNRTFHTGDPIRIQLVFSARAEGLSVNTTVTDPPSPIDTVTLTPISGVFNWMEDRARGNRYVPDYSQIENLEPGKPVQVTLTLNDIYRFDKPGHYSVRVTSRRLSGGMQDLNRIFPALTSNEITLYIRPADASAEAALAADLERRIRSASDLRSALALAERLDVLTGDAATEAKLSLFLHPKEFYPFEVSADKGLWIAPNRELVVRRLQQALADPAQTIRNGFFQTTVSLTMGLRAFQPPASATESEARDAIQARLCHLLAATLSQRSGQSRIEAAQTVFFTTVRSKQTASPDFRAAREILVTHFDDVDQYNVDILLNNGTYLIDTRLYPILLRMLENPNLSRNAILHFLAVHDSASIRPLLATELCTVANPVQTLQDAQIEVVPEADTCLLDRIRRNDASSDLANPRTGIELENGVAAAARFASPSNYPALLMLYQSGANHWSPQARGFALAYFAKWDFPQARPLLDAALPADANQMDGNITYALFQQSGAALLPLFRDRLANEMPGQAATAAYYLSLHGTLPDRELLRARLERWRAAWQGKDITSEQASVEAELTTAVAKGVNWEASGSERDTLRKECVTQACRDRVRQAVE